MDQDRRFSPLYWKEGLFLRPHHLQYLDHYHDTQLLYHSRKFNPYHWGIASLQINREALQNFIIEIDQAEIILWEGSILTYRGNCEIERKNFESSLSPTGPLSVYLGVRKCRLGNPTVTDAPDGGQNFRYLPQSDEIPDMNTGANESSIEFLKHNVTILINSDETVLQDYDFIKIAEIIETGKREPRFQLSPHYIPPSLTISSSEVLFGLVRRVLDVLTAKCEVLSRDTREKGLSLTQYGLSDIMTHFLRYTINSSLSLMQLHISEGWTHPYQMYTVLAQLYGSLTSFSQDREPWQMETYDHHNLAHCFSETAGQIIEMLDAVISTKYIRVPLEFDGEYFTAELDPSVLEVDNQYFLAVHGDMPVERIIEFFPAQVKISSKELMRELIQHALSGVRFQHIQEPPIEIPRQSNYAYFKLKAGPDWDQVVRNHNIVLYLGVEPRNLTVDLFVLKP